jgi:hypothetical protein
MRKLIAGFLIYCAAGAAHAAESATADLRASCNASFHDGCPSSSGGSVSSAGFSAPIGVIGSSPEEGASLALMAAITAGLSWRRRRRDASRRLTPQPREGYDGPDSQQGRAHPARQE